MESKKEKVRSKNGGPLLPTQSCAWQTSEPPKDGKVIVAIGRVIITEIGRTIVERFTCALAWQKVGTFYEGWVFPRGSMTVITDPKTEEVKIDYWIDLP